MKIKELTTGSVELVSADTTVQAAAEAMRDSAVGALPVAEEGVLEGMLTDRDIVVRAVAEGKDPRHTTVSEIMTNTVYTCNEDQNVEEVASLMKNKRVGYIVVLNKDDRPIGLVTLVDIAAHVNVQVSAATLETVYAPEPAKRRG